MGAPQFAPWSHAEGAGLTRARLARHAQGENFLTYPPDKKHHDRTGSRQPRRWRPLGPLDLDHVAGRKRVIPHVQLGDLQAASTQDR